MVDTRGEESEYALIISGYVVPMTWAEATAFTTEQLILYNRLFTIFTLAAARQLAGQTF
jgi:hypothetical protein